MKEKMETASGKARLPANRQLSRNLINIHFFEAAGAPFQMFSYFIVP